jgi:hypothetical protein
MTEGIYLGSWSRRSQAYTIRQGDLQGLQVHLTDLQVSQFKPGPARRNVDFKNDSFWDFSSKTIDPERIASRDRKLETQ